MRKRDGRGVTLIEAMVVLAVLGILAAIGIPNYSRYVMRESLIEAGNSLAEYRVRMERFYQDNRSYQSAGGGCGQAVPSVLDDFTVACAITAADRPLPRRPPAPGRPTVLCTRSITPTGVRQLRYRRTGAHCPPMRGPGG